MQSIAGALSFLGREAARIVLPAWCVCCGAELPWRNRTASCCGACWDAIPKISGVKCASCALPLAADEGARCLACQAAPLPVEWCEASCHYRGPAEHVLHAFKFSRHDFLDEPLAGLLEETLRARGDLDFDALVPVPMSRGKLRRRGYNQAELLARELSKKIAISCRPSLLVRRRAGQTQSTLARKERRANVREAFRASKKVDGLALLLVDDITTTGETLRACARELVRAGAARVCAIAVAKSV